MAIIRFKVIALSISISRIYGYLRDISDNYVEIEHFFGESILFRNYDKTKIPEIQSREGEIAYKKY